MKLSLEDRELLERLLSELEEMFPHSDAVIDVGCSPWRMSKAGAVHMGCRLVRLGTDRDSVIVNFEDLLKSSLTCGFGCKVVDREELKTHDWMEPPPRWQLFLVLGVSIGILSLVLIGLLSVIGIV